MPRKPLGVSQRDAGCELARRIGVARKERNWTQEALARESGVSIDTVRKLERCAIPSPGVFVIARLAKALATSLDTLLDGLADA